MKGYKTLEEGDEVIFDYDAEHQKATNLRKITNSLEEDNTDTE